MASNVSIVIALILLLVIYLIYTGKLSSQVILFVSPTCGHCTKLLAMLEAYRSEYCSSGKGCSLDHVQIVSAGDPEFDSLALKHDVVSFPTAVKSFQGIRLGKYVGNSEETFNAIVG